MYISHQNTTWQVPPLNLPPRHGPRTEMCALNHLILALPLVVYQHCFVARIILERPSSSPQQSNKQNMYMNVCKSMPLVRRGLTPLVLLLVRHSK